ncbi:MAG: tellurite resistance TerB family protein [Pigmentiphaga sp.]|nr:tellurite resistance TerB family protein [Pigmentiphaga sp.]MDX3905183.1 tellurite resistance TerB family protein [Pigmentiphaga sp.]
MSARQLLDQLLQSGQGLVRDVAGSRNRPAGSAAGGLENLLPGLTGGALGAGAIGLLLGSKKARKIGGKVALYGGMAALGALAYRAYNDWQAKQTQPAHEPQTADRLPPPEAERHSRAMLTAMIGAAKADGHIGEEERRLLETEIGKLGGDPADRQWLEAELARPLDPAVIAQAAATQEMAAEMYLASLIVVDEESYMERAYLDELARQLKLPADLKASLEQRLHAEAAA